MTLMIFAAWPLGMGRDVMFDRVMKPVSVSDQRVGALLERDAELAAIADLVHRVGAAGVLLVEGEAGIGKSALLAAVAELARGEPVRVLGACGGELERSFPFGIVGQLFGDAVAALSGERRASVLAGAAQLAVDVVDPHVGADVPRLASPEALFARLHGLYWLCAGLAAELPLVLIVDDAHWADEPSLHWLLFMARRIEDMPVTLVLSARSGDADDWPEPLVVLRNRASVSLMRPRPLSEQASGVVVRRLLGSEVEEPFVVACHEAAGGNPFLLSELIASVRADGLLPTAAAAPQIRSLAPEAITRSVVVRLGRISREAAALARGVAVLGAGAELRNAAALARLDLDAAATAADALAAAGLLDAGRPLRFAHPVLRTAVYREVPVSERALLHRRAAFLLAAEAADLDAIAAHLLAGEPAGDRRAVELLAGAGERALARGSPTTAASYLRRALAEPPAGEQRALVLRRLGVVESMLGDASAAEHAREALDLTGDPQRRAELAFDLSVAYIVAGRSGEAIGALEQGVQQSAERDPELRWRLEAQLISLARIDPAQAEVARGHLNAIPPDLAGDSPGERAILAELAFAATIAGEPVGAVADLARRAYGGGQLIAEQPRGSMSLLSAISALVATEQHELAMSACDELIERTRREGSPISFALISQRRAQLHYLRGAIPDSLADAQAALDAGAQFGQSVLFPSLYGALIDALLEADDIHGAEKALARSGVGEQIPDTLLFSPLLHSRGRLRLAQGDTQAGIEDVLAEYRLLARFGITNPVASHSRSIAAVALAGLGQHEEARRLVADELAAARKFGAPATVGRSLRAAGVIEPGSAGIDQLHDAVAHLQRSPARLEHARALADLGTTLRRAGKRRQAQLTLRQALDLADRCGGKAVAERARSELLVTGARPRRTRITGVEALTASELRVARLAVQGLTNRQIAQALFVSQPTVATHLSHCYQKLNISSREQLSIELARTSRADDP